MTNAARLFSALLEGGRETQSYQFHLMIGLIRCACRNASMTRMTCAWRKANAYMRSGEHAKAIYWLSRTLAILDNERPRRRRLEIMDTDYLLAVFISVVVWIAIAKFLPST